MNKFKEKMKLALSKCGYTKISADTWERRFADWFSLTGFSRFRITYLTTSSQFFLHYQGVELEVKSTEDIHAAEELCEPHYIAQEKIWSGIKERMQA